MKTFAFPASKAVGEHVGGKERWFGYLIGPSGALLLNAATQNVFTFFFVGLEVIVAVILVVLLKFLDVEKHIEKEQAEIKARKVQEVE